MKSFPTSYYDMADMTSLALTGNLYEMTNAVPHWVKQALLWAKAHLGVNGPMEQRARIKGVRGFTLGQYHSDTRSITFCDEPSLETVFHEAVHFWQHECGADFVASRADSRAHHSNVFEAYYNDRYEVEARAKAADMCEMYPGPKPMWSPSATRWNGNGLYSDHTYY